MKNIFILINKYYSWIKKYYPVVRDIVIAILTAIQAYKLPNL